MTEVVAGMVENIGHLTEAVAELNEMRKSHAQLEADVASLMVNAAHVRETFAEEARKNTEAPSAQSRTNEIPALLEDLVGRVASLEALMKDESAHPSSGTALNDNMLLLQSLEGRVASIEAMLEGQKFKSNSPNEAGGHIPGAALRASARLVHKGAPTDRLEDKKKTGIDTGALEGVLKRFNAFEKSCNERLDSMDKRVSTLMGQEVHKRCAELETWCTAWFAYLDNKAQSAGAGATTVPPPEVWWRTCATREKWSRGSLRIEPPKSDRALGWL